MPATQEKPKKKIPERKCVGCNERRPKNELVRVLRTPEGERPVRPGEFLFFPTGPEGAHKLTNTSDTENLVYIDFDTVNEVDVTIYPDSGKIGVWGMGVNQVYPQDAAVDYYHGE